MAQQVRLHPMRNPGLASGARDPLIDGPAGERLATAAPLEEHGALGADPYYFCSPQRIERQGREGYDAVVTIHRADLPPAGDFGLTILRADGARADHDLGALAWQAHLNRRDFEMFLVPAGCRGLETHGNAEIENAPEVRRGLPIESPPRTSNGFSPLCTLPWVSTRIIHHARCAAVAAQ